MHLRLGWLFEHGTPNQRSATARQIIWETALMEKARRHLTIEVGGKRSVAAAHRMARLLGRFEKDGSRTGLDFIEVNSINLSTSPHTWDACHGFGLQLWGVRDNRIQWTIQLYSGVFGTTMGIRYRVGKEAFFRYARTVSQAVRQAAKAYCREESMSPTRPAC